MIKRGLLAAGMVLAVAAPALAQVQITPAPPPDRPDRMIVTPQSSTTTIIVAPTPPPAPRVEAPPPPPPSTTMVWRPGHWTWDVAEARYDWIDGRYIERPAAVADYTPGHWDHRPDGYVWIDGTWR